MDAVDERIELVRKRADLLTILAGERLDLRTLVDRAESSRATPPRPAGTASALDHADADWIADRRERFETPV